MCKVHRMVLMSSFDSLNVHSTDSDPLEQLANGLQENPTRNDTASRKDSRYYIYRNEKVVQYKSKINMSQEFSPPRGRVVSSININYSYTHRLTIHLRMCVSVFLSCKGVAG